MYTRLFSMMVMASLTAASAVMAGCDGGGGATTEGTGGQPGSGGGSTGGGGSGGGGGPVAAAPETVVGFDPAKGEFVEGLEYHDGIAYVGAVLTGQLFEVDVAAKTFTTLGATPPFAQNTAALVGLARGPDGDVYAALNAFAPGGPATGVYRFPKGGGEATLFASSPELQFGNDVRFDGEDMYVTDSFTGSIFKIAKGQTTPTKWVSDPLLAPDPSVCNVETMFHLGVNGIIRKGDAFYVTNTDRASIVKIPVNADGSAGTPEIHVASDCAALSGADGIVVDPHTGDLLVAVNYKNAIVRVKADKTVAVIAEGGPLQSPASLSIDTERGALLITSAAFAELATDPSKAKPALVSLSLK